MNELMRNFYLSLLRLHNTNRSRDINRDINPNSSIYILAFREILHRNTEGHSNRDNKINNVNTIKQK